METKTGGAYQHHDKQHPTRRRKEIKLPGSKTPKHWNWESRNKQTDRKTNKTFYSPNQNYSNKKEVLKNNKKNVYTDPHKATDVNHVFCQQDQLTKYIRWKRNSQKK